ncbi:hypothetical protein Bbelb_039300 [Branchiostoma belcheri]|nr:hypothetical protein Bbelb_039300 [Branchiostoma belcheri]
MDSALAAVSYRFGPRSPRTVRAHSECRESAERSWKHGDLGDLSALSPRFGQFQAKHSESAVLVEWGSDWEARKATLRNAIQHVVFCDVREKNPRDAFKGGPYDVVATVTTRRTCFYVLSTCKNVGKRRASVHGEYRLRTESYGIGSTQTRRSTSSACKAFSTCGLRIHHPCVRVRATRVPRTCRAEEARVSTASLR